MLKILNNTKAQPVLGVLFDLDGVVIDTEKLYTRFWMEAARELGHPMTLEQALQMRSLGRGPSQEKLDSFFGPGVLDYDTLRARRIERMDAFIAVHGVEEKPGIRALLALLQEKGIPCAITSSSSVPLIREHLGNLGLLDYFTALCSGKDVPKGKPAPDIYLEAARRVGAVPEECLVFEDVCAGICAGKSAGMKVCAVADPFSEEQWEEKKAMADYDIEDYLELIDGYEV